MTAATLQNSPNLIKSGQIRPLLLKLAQQVRAIRKARRFRLFGDKSG